MPRKKTRPIAETVDVDSLPEYLRAIDKAQSEFRYSNLWFRGHASTRWKLQPSLYRGLHDFMHEDLERWSRERTMFVQFQSAAYSRSTDLPAQTEISKWLCLMRHYGLSTRLLDWSKSPLVAAYFALLEKPYKTPTIWILNPSALNEYEETVAPVLTLRDETPEKKLENHLVDVANNKHDENSILAVHPPEVDNRIFAQKAVFTIHGTSRPIQELNIGKPFLFKVKLSKKAASDIAKSLILFGYQDSYMFPDLEHLANELAHKYKWSQ